MEGRKDSQNYITTEYPFLARRIFYSIFPRSELSESISHANADVNTSENVPYLSGMATQVKTARPPIPSGVPLAPGFSRG